ncbi:hypothetical protein [Neokomagataea anthophila]|nr:hypothetical protein [Neokomagataea anthophila]
MALSSGVSRDRIAQDLGIGASTLKKWIRNEPGSISVIFSVHGL